MPLDELLLQLAESLHKTLGLTGSEVWTGTDGVLDRVVSVPSRPPARIHLSEDELAVVARAHVSGNAWIQVWIPALLAGRQAGPVRVVSITHLGELLGLIVVERSVDGAPFDEDDDQGLSELARPLGLALHNVRLDSALQASLDELRQRNQELRASRARIVAASDDSRRQIERNLHDGAQQHLVAMAVKIGLARRLLEPIRRPPRRCSRSCAAMSRTPCASCASWPMASTRRCCATAACPRPCRRPPTGPPCPPPSRPTDIGRYPEGVETAVYFCCLEAMQNAGKHAGDHAELTVQVSVDAPGQSAPGAVLLGARRRRRLRSGGRRRRSRLRQHARPARGHRRDAARSPPRPARARPSPAASPWHEAALSVPADRAGRPVAEDPEAVPASDDQTLIRRRASQMRRTSSGLKSSLCT